MQRRITGAQAGFPGAALRPRPSRPKGRRRPLPPPGQGMVLHRRWSRKTTASQDSLLGTAIIFHTGGRDSLFTDDLRLPIGPPRTPDWVRTLGPLPVSSSRTRFLPQLAHLHRAAVAPTESVTSEPYAGALALKLSDAEIPAPSFDGADDDLALLARWGCLSAPQPMRESVSSTPTGFRQHGSTGRHARLASTSPPSRLPRLLDVRDARIGRHHRLPHRSRGRQGNQGNHRTSANRLPTQRKPGEQLQNSGVKVVHSRRVPVRFGCGQRSLRHPLLLTCHTPALPSAESFGSGGEAPDGTIPS